MAATPERESMIGRRFIIVTVPADRYFWEPFTVLSETPALLRIVTATDETVWITKNRCREAMKAGIIKLR